MLKGGFELGSDIDEFAFGHVVAPDILVSEDVACVLHFGGATVSAFIGVWAVGASGVGGSFEKDWAEGGQVFWNVDGGVKFGSITHWDHVLVLLVLILLRLGKGKEWQCEKAQGKSGTHHSFHFAWFTLRMRLFL